MDLPPTPEIVVTGTALPAASGSAAYANITLTRDRLTSTASGRIEDALKDVAGLAAFRRTDSRTANPTSQGVTLRGLGGNASSRALVLLDGVPIADPFAGYIPWSAIDPHQLASVRVTRGGGTGAFGVGAVAGTLDLASAGPDQLAPLSLAVAGGSRDALEASAGLAARLGSGFVTASLRHDSGDGFLLTPPDRAGPVDIPAAYRSWAGSLRAVMPIDAETELQVSGRAFDDRRTRGLALAGSTSSGADASVRIVHRGTWGVDALAYVQAREFTGTFAAVNAARTIATPSLDQFRTPATGLGAKLEIRPPLGNLQIGLDARSGSGTTNEKFRFVTNRFTRLRRAGGSVATIGGYVEDSWKPGDQWTLTGGARLDHWQIGAGQLNEFDIDTNGSTYALDTPARSGWRATARAGAVFRPVPALALRTAAYSGFRVPTPNELYRPFRVGADATAANPALDLERSRGMEAGLDWRPLSTARLSVTAYVNQIRGAIANVTLATGPGTFPQVGFVAGSYRQRQNLQAVTVHGIEADAGLDIGNWNAQASLAYADPKVSAPGTALDGLRPANTPQFNASATLGWSQTRLRAAITLRHTSAQFDDDQNQRRLPPATTLDATAAITLTRGLSLEARAENLTDTLVVSGLSADGLIDRAQPRTFWLGLRWTR